MPEKLWGRHDEQSPSRRGRRPRQIVVNDQMARAVVRTHQSGTGPPADLLPADLCDLDASTSEAMWRRKQLLAVLRWHLTRFWKQRDFAADSAWRPCGVRELQACVRRLVAFNRHSKNIRRSLEQWVTAHPHRDPVASADSESSFLDRQEHRLEFWAKYRSKPDKTELPLARRPPAKGRDGARGAGQAEALGGAPLETHGDFWRAAISPMPQPRAKQRRRRSAQTENPTDSVGKKSRKADMSWTRRAARDTHGFANRRWAIGQQLHVEEESSEDQQTEKEIEPSVNDKRHLHLVPDVKGADGARLVLAKMDRPRHARGSQSQIASEHWQSQIASVVAAARHEVDNDMFEDEGHTWNITGVKPSGRDFSSSRSCTDLRGKQDACAPVSPWSALKQQPDSKKTAKTGMGKRASSLPALTQRAAVTSMYRPRATAKSGLTKSVLPPINKAFKDSTPGQAPTGDLNASPTKRYVKVCQKFGILPTPMPCVTGQSPKLDGSDRALTDDELLAFAAIVRSMDRIEEVDLDGNTLLTEKALVSFFRKLFGPPASSSLTRFSIKRCVHAGRMPLEIVVELLDSSNGLRRLRQLDLAGVPIAMKCHLPLAEAVCDHPYLRSVSLADTGLGSSPVARQCVSQLLSSNSLQALDIGWNSFGADVFSEIGSMLVETQTLHSLVLANCSAVSKDATPTPAMYFLEYLARDRMLEFLDLSLNRLDFHGALILEDALENHSRLAKLNLSQNPLGVLGMRSIIRLLSRDSSGLFHPVCEACFAMSEPLQGTDIFRVAIPNGNYSLDLSQPYDRSVLRMLLKTCERLNISVAQSFAGVGASPPQLALPSEKDDAGVWPVPSEGNFMLNFCPLKAMNLVAKSADSLQLGPHLDAFVERLKLRPSLRKMVPLLALWQSIEGRIREQTFMIESISRDFMFTYPQFQQICKSRLYITRATEQLLHCIHGGDASRFLSFLLPQTLSEQIGIQTKVNSLLEFSVENPTGHYILDLENPVDLAIAERLFLLDRWETRLALLQGDRPDTSQRGNWSQFRNEHYQKQPLGLPTMADWCLPGVGILEFDYASSRRPHRSARPLDADTFRGILQALHQSECESADQIQTLRRVSSDIFFTSRQLRQLMMHLSAHAAQMWQQKCDKEDQQREQEEELAAERACIKEENLSRAAELKRKQEEDEKRAREEAEKQRFEEERRKATEQHRKAVLAFLDELVVLFFFRVVDIWNSKIFRVRCQDCNALSERLGHVNFFLFFQLENEDYEWQLSSYEQRLTANLVVNLTLKEPHSFIQNPVYLHADGTEDTLPMGVPKGWANLKSGMPTSGSFKANYVCSPEDRRFFERCRICKQFGRWHIDLDHDIDVAWWKALTEVPEDVITYLAAIVSQYQSTSAAFLAVDGVDGNGVISLSEFQDSMHLVHCKHFHGQQGRERAKIIFRYLDSSGEGDISMKEWSVLDQLWQELALSIKEYTECISIPFKGCLKAAWNQLDEDGSGSLDHDEWCAAADKFGYHGPAHSVFHFLDKDGAKQVTYEKFLALQQGGFSPLRRRAAVCRPDPDDLKKLLQVPGGATAS